MRTRFRRVRRRHRRRVEEQSEDATRHNKGLHEVRVGRWVEPPPPPARHRDRLCVVKARRKVVVILPSNLRMRVRGTGEKWDREAWEGRTKGAAGAALKRAMRGLARLHLVCVLDDVRVEDEGVVPPHSAAVWPD